MFSVPCVPAGGFNCDSSAQSRDCVDGVWRCPPGTIELAECFAQLRGGTGGTGGVSAADGAGGTGDNDGGAGCAEPNPNGCSYPDEFATCPGNPAKCVNGEWQCPYGALCKDYGADSGAADGSDAHGRD